jgi:hypothetical protein
MIDIEPGYYYCSGGKRYPNDRAIIRVYKKEENHTPMMYWRKGFEESKLHQDTGWPTKVDWTNCLAWLGKDKINHYTFRSRRISEELVRGVLFLRRV